MVRYSLCMDGDTWSIIDEATQGIAKIDGIQMSDMPIDEARQMLRILKTIESVRSLSVRSSVSARKLAKRVPAAHLPSLR